MSCCLPYLLLRKVIIEVHSEVVSGTHGLFLSVPTCKGKNLVVLSVNCQGLRTQSKRIDVLNYLKGKKTDILCLQDTHWLSSDIKEIKKIWDGECIINGCRSNSRGVAILLGKNFEYKLSETKGDELGNMISVSLKMDSFSLKIINVYGPNKDSPEFYNTITDCMLSSQETYTLLRGDLKLTLDPQNVAITTLL